MSMPSGRVVRRKAAGWTFTAADMVVFSLPAAGSGLLIMRSVWPAAARFASLLHAAPENI